MRVLTWVSPDRRTYTWRGQTAETLATIARDGTSAIASVVGVQGPQGLPGAVAGSFDHIQAVASAVWTITHNLGAVPNIAVSTDGGTPLYGVVAHSNGFTITTITFSVALTGRARLT